MKSGAKKRHATADKPKAFGLFSKSEAVHMMTAGVRNIHSSSLGDRDTLAVKTEQALLDGYTPTYSWEKLDEGQRAMLTESKTRYDVIQRLLSDLGLAGRRDLNEKARMVLEELITNAIFHSYRNPDGSEKYHRAAAAVLTHHERVEIRGHATDTGVFVSVTDQGGSQTFETIVAALRRCYEKGQAQIEDKDGGAGLGLYMVFETVTHWKIACDPGKSTTVSCWIADKKNFDPDKFSFNFFEGE